MSYQTWPTWPSWHPHTSGRGIDAHRARRRGCAPPPCSSGSSRRPILAGPCHCCLPCLPLALAPRPATSLVVAASVVAASVVAESVVAEMVVAEMVVAASV